VVLVLVAAFPRYKVKWAAKRMKDALGCRITAPGDGQQGVDDVLWVLRGISRGQRWWRRLVICVGGGHSSFGKGGAGRTKGWRWCNWKVDPGLWTKALVAAQVNGGFTNKGI